MEVSYICIDHFYNNVDQVREFALSQPFDVVGNFPGKRTQSLINSSTQEAIQDILYSHAGTITNWHLEPGGYTGSFQLVSEGQNTWIHTDYHNTWAGVLYLSPDAPGNCGTGLYRHKKSNSLVEYSEFESDYPIYSHHPEDFELFDVIGNRYNRLILYRSNRFHCSLGYFGQNFSDSRLFQVFFIDTEY